MRNPPVPPGFWRGVNLNQNTIYLESFIDEIAHLRPSRTRWPSAAS
jgi:isoquinoline 1-oxidoreductase beta subunit